MFYNCEKMKNVCRNFAEDITISQLWRVIKMGGINPDRLSISEVKDVIIADEYSEILIDIIYNEQDNLRRCSFESDNAMVIDIYWSYMDERPKDKTIRLIADIVEAGHLSALQAICDDLQIAINVY